MTNTIAYSKCIIFLLLTISLSAQTNWDSLARAAGQETDKIFGLHLPDNTLKTWTWTGGNLYFSGFFDGLGEVLTAKYDHFQRVFPEADPTYWDRDRSSYRKWKNGDPEQGEAYFGSSTFLVWTTDGYHMSRFMRNNFMRAAIVIPLCQNRKKWYWYLIDSFVYSAAYSLGFHTSYTLILNGMR